jgi:protein phosphatase
MPLTIPELSLVTLIGCSGSGKSTFARRHFKPTEILSSDYCRGLVSDDENSHEATKDAFEVLHFIAAKRLAAGKLTVIDATNVQPDARRPLVALARQYHCLPVAIVLNLPERTCAERNRERPDRDFPAYVIRQQRQQLRRSLRGLKREGFRHIYILESPEDVDAATIERQPLWNNRRAEHGPFDIIGDIHGCCGELEALLAELGYEAKENFSLDDGWAGPIYKHPHGRKAVFVGDIGDRGPRILDAIRLVRNMVNAGSALCVPGNHDIKLHRKLTGRNVQITHGLDRTLAEIDSLADEIRVQFSEALAEFIDSLVSHYVFDDGRLVVAHAGLKEEMQGRGSGKVREFALYGETTGETDEFGLPVRYNWASEYRGTAMVVYGHTPVPEAEWLNRTINIDTGCVFGGRLTALRYPEKELVSVPARHTYCQPRKPFIEHPAPVLSAQQEHDDVLEIESFLGKLIVSTRLAHNVTVREENALAALEVMSRFAENPKWLIYLPPTMSPCETSREPGLLEHPAEAFTYYRQEGVPQVVCEEKHMGSRAVIVIGRDENVIQRRFGLQRDGAGVCYTRTGRRFFRDTTLETAFLDRVRAAAERAKIWDALTTDWICLDCELMPWSVKAQELIREQYAAAGAAALAALPEAVAALATTANRFPDVQPLLERYQNRLQVATQYVDAYRRYCWPVESVDELKLAPFHVLASEDAVHTSRNHVWHMEVIQRLCSADDMLFLATPCRVVDVTDETSQSAAVRWWEELTTRGGEGMVVKPLDFIAKGHRRLAQPALKVRGREYLRIIYGPEYTLPENLERLRSRGLAAKRSLAMREFALGVEALERFVRREPLRRVHECVFAVLALESEPVDPRL